MSLSSYDIARWIREQTLRLLVPLPDAVALFGSFTRENLLKESDVDLLLIGDRIPTKPYERSQWVHPLLDAWRKWRLTEGEERTLSPLILSRRGWVDSVGLRLSLADHLWILYDDGLISSTINETREWLRQGRWERKTSRDGGWLWIPREVRESA